MGARMVGIYSESNLDSSTLKVNSPTLKVNSCGSRLSRFYPSCEDFCVA
jgi:hypothetical protein